MTQMAPYAGLQTYEIYYDGMWVEMDSEECTVVPRGAPFLIMRASHLSEDICPALPEFIARYTAGVSSGAPETLPKESDAPDSENEVMA